MFEKYRPKLLAFKEALESVLLESTEQMAAWLRTLLRFIF